MTQFPFRKSTKLPNDKTYGGKATEESFCILQRLQLLAVICNQDTNTLTPGRGRMPCKKMVKQRCVKHAWESHGSSSPSAFPSKHKTSSGAATARNSGAQPRRFSTHRPTLLWSSITQRGSSCACMFDHGRGART